MDIQGARQWACSTWTRLFSRRGRANMCGIAGILAVDGRERDLADPLLRMTNRMSHRGPDDEGFVLIDAGGTATSYSGDTTPDGADLVATIPGYPNSHVREAFGRPARLGLGHRRLSILDLSPHGHQPMRTIDGRYWMVYNGEIFNFAEIANELSRLGIRLHGTSDSEILINAYAQWGEACLSRFNGMYAFAIWDQKTRSLFCARDRIGIKPFHYAIVDGVFVFGSDIRSVLASGLVKPRPNMHGIYLSLAFGIAPRPITAFKNIVALEQAHWMRVHSTGKIEKDSYWSVPIDVQQHRMSEDEAVNLLEDELTKSIKLQLNADVDVGTFMSGGIDSTTMSAIAATHQPAIKAYTLANESGAPELDESVNAELTARDYDMRHIIYRVNPDAELASLSRWIDFYEEPYFSLAATDVLSRVAKENGSKVVLNGLGGDELFAGYNWYGFVGIWRKLRRLGPVTRLLAPLLGERSTKLLEVAQTTSADRLHTALYANLTDTERQDLFKLPEAKDWNTIEEIRRIYADGIIFDDPIVAISYMDLKNYIGNHFVHRVDQFTMANSIEGRFPFLDCNLVEASYRIPSRYKLNGKTHKYVLRRVAERYIAPECLAMKKRGFGLPLDRWMKGPLKNVVDAKIDALSQREFMNAAVILRWKEEYGQGKRKFNKIWQLVALELWYEHFFEQDNSAGNTAQN
ncbi:MAG: asparagine synthase (glutamine-hydrolyzing) [Rhizobiales bacterium]|nr:asparagine synthase (glutamine-hydrolyzing) [Hyphomicrobiales bacterium]